MWLKWDSVECSIFILDPKKETHCFAAFPGEVFLKKVTLSQAERNIHSSLFNKEMNTKPISSPFHLPVSSQRFALFGICLFSFL